MRAGGQEHGRLQAQKNPRLRTPGAAAVTPKGDPGHNQVLGGVLILLLNRVEMITQRLPPVRGAIRREVIAALQ